MPGVSLPRPGRPVPDAEDGHEDAVNASLATVPTADLVGRAVAGEQTAWDALVDRYGRLVLNICRSYRLGDADVHDVSQTVWLRLVEHLAHLRKPDALPGWLATTTRRHCLLLLRTTSRHPVHELPGDDQLVDEEDEPDEAVLRAERQAALRAAFSELPPRHQDLLRLLMADPPFPYHEISRRLGLPVGSIGPTRARCLDKLRTSPALTACIATGPDVDIDLDNRDQDRSPR